MASGAVGCGHRGQLASRGRAHRLRRPDREPLEIGSTWMGSTEVSRPLVEDREEKDFSWTCEDLHLDRGQR